MSTIQEEEFQTYCPKLQRNVCFDYYKLLEISQEASNEEIKKAYHQLARKYHPDTCLEVDKDKAKEKFKIIGTAYKHLINPTSRSSYNSFLEGLTIKQLLKQKIINGISNIFSNPQKSELQNVAFSRSAPLNSQFNLPQVPLNQSQFNHPTSEPNQNIIENQSYYNEPGFMDPELYQSRLFQYQPQSNKVESFQGEQQQRETFPTTNYSQQIRLPQLNLYFQNGFQQQPQQQQPTEINFNQYSFLRNYPAPNIKLEDKSDSFFEKYKPVYQWESQQVRNSQETQVQSSSNLNQDLGKSCQINSPSLDIKVESEDHADSKKETEPNKKSAFKKVLLTKHSILKQYKSTYENRIIDKIKKKTALFTLIKTKKNICKKNY